MPAKGGRSKVLREAWAWPQGLASAHLPCTVKTRLNDTFVMCHPVLKLHSKAQRRREASSPWVTKASLPLMDQPHRQETASSAACMQGQEHTCSPPPLTRGRWFLLSPRKGAGGRGALQGAGLPRELPRASRSSCSHAAAWKQSLAAPAGLRRLFSGRGGGRTQPTQVLAEQQFLPCRRVLKQMSLVCVYKANTALVLWASPQTRASL